MSYWVLTAQGTVISRKNVQHITHIENQTAENKDSEEEFQRIISNKDLPEANDSFTPDLYGCYLQMELAFNRGDDIPSFAKVTKRLRNAQGLPIGTANDNPILDTCMYEVEYLDEFTTIMAANSIA